MENRGITWQPAPDANEEPIVISRAIPSGMALVPIKPDTDADVIALVESAKTICQYAATRSITTQEDVSIATEDLSLLSKTIKSVKVKQVQYTEPYRTLLAGIDDVFKPVIASLVLADTITRSKILAYRAEVDRKRREAEEVNRLREEANRKEAALNEGVITDTRPLVEVPAAAPKTVRTDVGSAGIVKNWHYRITNFALLDNIYKLENTVVLNSIAKKIGKGIPPTISGVEFYTEESLRITTK